MNTFSKLKWMQSTDFGVLTAVLCALGLGGFAFGEFVLFAFRANLPLNTLILVALLFGSGLIYQRSYFLYRERTAMCLWLEHAKQKSTKLFDRPAFMKNCIVNEMLNRLDRSSQSGEEPLQADMIEKESERISHRIEREQDLCRFMVGLMVALGLLGTFVGLLQTLVQVSDLVGTIGDGITDSSNAEMSMANVIAGLRNPMAAMGTAFSASMFGLIGSIALGLQMVRLGSTTSHTQTEIRANSLQGLELVARPQPKSRSMEDTLKQYLVELAEQGRKISTSFGMVAMLSESALPKLGDMNLHIRETAVQSVNFVEALHSATDALREFGNLPERLHGVLLAQQERNNDLNNTLETIADTQARMLKFVAAMHANVASPPVRTDE